MRNQRINSTRGIAFIFLCFLSSSSYAQSRLIEVTSKRNDDQTVDFFYEKRVVGSYVLSISFGQLTNCTFNGYHGTVAGHSGKLFTLKPTQTTQGISYSFQYQYIRGIYNPKIDPSFIYLLPFYDGKKVLVRELSNLDHKYLGGDLPDNWKAYMFSAKPGDTVYAVRKGIVVEVEEKFASDTEKDFSFRSNVNKVIIEQADGTFCRYSGFEKGEIFVQEGDKVLPQTPLGILGQYDKKGDGQLRVMIYYFDKSKYRGQNFSDDQKNYYSFVIPQFHTTSGNLSLIDGKTYEVSVNDELIGAEMNKREKKQFFGDR